METAHEVRKENDLKPRLLTWNEDSGTVSRAFDDWKWNDGENRAFLRQSAQWSTKSCQQTWDDAQESFAARFDPDRHYGDEQVDCIGGRHC